MSGRGRKVPPIPCLCRHSVFARRPVPQTWSGGGPGLREENASKQKHRAPVLIPSEPKGCGGRNLRVNHEPVPPHRSLPSRRGAASYGAPSRPLHPMAYGIGGLCPEMLREKAPVAQLDRASDYESEGRTFESFRARHSRTKPRTLRFSACFPARAASRTMSLPMIRRPDHRPRPHRQSNGRISCAQEYVVAWLLHPEFLHQPARDRRDRSASPSDQFIGLAPGAQA
jgi:hypothetical protein